MGGYQNFNLYRQTREQEDFPREGKELWGRFPRKEKPTTFMGVVKACQIREQDDYLTNKLRESEDMKESMPSSGSNDNLDKSSRRPRKSKTLGDLMAKSLASKPDAKTTKPKSTKDLQWI